MATAFVSDTAFWYLCIGMGELNHQLMAHAISPRISTGFSARSLHLCAWVYTYHTDTVSNVTPCHVVMDIVSMVTIAMVTIATVTVQLHPHFLGFGRGGYFLQDTSLGRCGQNDSLCAISQHYNSMQVHVHYMYM